MTLIRTRPTTAFAFLLAGALTSLYWSPDPALSQTPNIAGLQALEAAEEALDAAWDKADLHFGEVLFVKAPAVQYGEYAPRDSNVFGLDETMYIYAEPRAFGYGVNSGRYMTDLRFDLFIFDAAGELVLENIGFSTLSLNTLVRNREVMVLAEVNLKGAPAGSYQIDIEMTDQNKGQTDIVGLPFRIGR